MYAKRTLRRMQPTRRKLAERINEMETTLRRLKRLMEDVAEMEVDANLERARRHFPATLPTPDGFGPDMGQAQLEAEAVRRYA